MGSQSNDQMKVVTGEYGYVLQDVPHLTDYIPDLPTYPNPLRSNPAYSVVKQYFVDMDDSVPEKVVVHKDTPRGVHFRRAGPRQKVYFASDEVHACIVTCGGLCPGLNTVIREIVHSLDYMYGVSKVLGIDGGYRGFYAKNTITLTPKVVNDIHKRGGTILGTSRGGHDTMKIVDSIQDRGINQACVEIEIRKRGLKVAVAGIPKTIDNDIPVIDRSFGFDTAVEEAQRAINAAHVEAESAENGIGVVKLMGRYSGFIAMYATLASRDVDCCLIPESPFYLGGKDPTYMIRAIPSNASDNVYCTLLAQSAVHGAMAGFTGFTSGLVNGRQTYIPFNRITEKQHKVVITDRMWARLLSSTNQPSFLGSKDDGVEDNEVGSDDGENPGNKETGTTK
ncbi:UNVERIFIED_CONTAM: ATP-dependent 6-phosphofructokinase [Sesamum angustifolium]|uniref:ATP-dependent 6-phosphofructokinase n=1 Tax=Sesamum angustifolium TaxID=2727405 RepID=A0AAW2MBR4_9LAMI